VSAPGARHGRLGLRRQLLLSMFAGVGVLLGLGAGPAWAGALLPERGGSPNADRIASLYTVVLVMAAIVFVGVAATLIFSLARYRQRRSPLPVRIRGNTRLEIGWTVAAALVIVFLSAFSFTKLGAIEHPDRTEASSAAAAEAGVGDGGQDALHIDVVGRQFVWMFKYPNGAYSYEEMVAPVGVTVELDIVSVDVAHSWWVPKLGGKFDAVPGYVNHTWFRLKQAGVYKGQCAELCGRDHARMLAQVRGVSPVAYASWVARQKRLIDAANATAAREHAQAPSGRR
jgi:cytochrome c oxidase subunit II